MAKHRNIFACLVHESSQCVIDLVRNLHCVDPASAILLYNGGSNAGLLQSGFPFERYGAIVHPSPRPMAWGHLHDFALDCMRFALAELPFDTLTIVDSDQLGTRAGYSKYLAAFMENRKEIGLLGSSPEVRHQVTEVGPANAALNEIELWRPFLRRFRGGEEKFVHWSFWPSTVFTAEAARDLTQLFTNDGELRTLMGRSRIWATEEVILPTLVALLGYEIAANPCSCDYVKYRASYTSAEIDVALSRDDVFWVHPVPRKYEDPLRQRIRERHGQYQISADADGGLAVTDSRPRHSPGLVLSLPILKKMRTIPGWLDDAEADLLIAASSRALTSLPDDSAVVEIGSFCGRSTVVLGSVVQSLGAPTKVYAIDPHDGVVGALDSGTQALGPTLEIFRRNISQNALTAIVEPIALRPSEVSWKKPIGFLLIDHLHDYGSVSQDFHHFEPWVVDGGYIAFHDYVDYFPGVKSLVDEILSSPQFEQVYHSGSMIVIRKVPATAACAEGKAKTAGMHGTARPQLAEVVQSSAEAVSLPLVSCLMATADRRTLVPQAIRHFLRQDYANCELIIMDDGADSISDLVPDNERIRYIRLPQRVSIGAKHNMACEMARGEIILHWDDDDWHAGRRISYQVSDLRRCSPDTLCGLARVLFYEPTTHRAWEYVYPSGGRPWVAGATFCYFKTFWERHRFPDMNEGGDTVFVWNLQNANVVPHQDHTFYVGTVHARNTSPKRTETGGWHPLSSHDIRNLLDKEDWSFYERFCINDNGRL